MGKIDTITKKYMENPVVFADAFNQFLYHGEQKVDPARLTELWGRNLGCAPFSKRNVFQH